MTRWYSLLAAGAAVFGLGSVPATAAEPAASAVTAQIDLRPIDDKSLKAELEKRKGKIVLISMWSRSCPPCIEAYPELVEMGRKYGPQGLEILSINVIDDERTRRDWTIPFLQKQNPTFATFYEKADDDEAFIRALDPKWYGGLPAEFLYNRQGKRIASMTEDVDMDKLEKLIVQHLSGTPETSLDSSMASLREYIEGKGGVLIWKPSTRTVEAKVGDRSLVVKVGSRNAQVDQKTIVMERPSAIEDGRTMVPASFLEKAFSETG